MRILETDKLRIYVIHYTPFKERKHHLLCELEKSGLDRFAPYWIKEYDREEIESNFNEGVYGTINSMHINPSVISVILKHIQAIKLAAQSTIPYHLIFEDDIFIPKDFLKKLTANINQMPEDWEILFVGDGCNLHIPFWQKKWGRYVYFRGWNKKWWGGGGMSRCGAGYLINPESARRFLTSQHAKRPYETAIDWLMNKVGADLKFKSYWSEPPLVKQGAFPSWTINSRLRS